MYKHSTLICAAVLFTLAGPTSAEIGTIDEVPAATLLLPRFEVDIHTVGCAGRNTLLSVNNASADSTVAHVTIWSEWTIPVLDFDIYLTGYDVQTLSLCEVIMWRSLPSTGPRVRPEGAFSQPNAEPPGCSLSSVPNGISPTYGDLSIDPALAQAVMEALSGVPVFFNSSCYSATGGGTIASGFVTIDNVRECSQEFPASPTYFEDGGAGIANNDNILWGDYFLVEPTNNLAVGMPLVHLEASSDLVVANGSCDPAAGYDPTTFYCFTGDVPGEDNREALPTTFAARFLTGGLFDAGTTLLSYRDANRLGAPIFQLDPGPCTVTPPKMGNRQIVAFNEREDPVIVETGGPSGIDEPDLYFPFPYCTNRTELVAGVTGDRMLDIDAFEFGWLYLDMNTGEELPNGTPVHNQAWVAAVSRAEGRFSVGLDAIQLDNLTLGSGGPFGPIR